MTSVACTFTKTGLRGAELAEATLDHIAQYPVNWDQSTSICGSTCCFMGRAVLIHHGLEDEWEYDAFLTEQVLLTGIPATDIFTEAVDLLGWRDDDADYIYGTMTCDREKLAENVRMIMAETEDRKRRMMIEATTCRQSR
jgi:hypothetical protein